MKPASQRNELTPEPDLAIYPKPAEIGQLIIVQVLLEMVAVVAPVQV